MYQIIKAISSFMLVFINNIYCCTQTCLGLSLCIYLQDRATIRWETPDNSSSLSNTIFFRHTSFSAVLPSVTHVTVLASVFYLKTLKKPDLSHSSTKMSVRCSLLHTNQQSWSRHTGNLQIFHNIDMQLPLISCFKSNRMILIFLINFKVLL